MIKYIGSHDAVDVAGRTVTKGEAVDLGDLEKSLLEQADNWQPVKTATKKTEA